MNRLRARSRPIDASWRRRLDERGQAAMALVLGLVLLLVTSGSILATNAIQHDPLVQTDVLEHYAYRALEAGMNSYLNTINAHPNYVNCSSPRPTHPTPATCSGITYDNWKTVTAPTLGVTEHYLWANPQLCFAKTFGTKCTATAALAKTDGYHMLEYVQVLVVGAAGTPGHYVYQSSVANFEPTNGFLTHLWWTKYESVPNKHTATSTACLYDWANSYQGPGANCTPVYFGSGTRVDGPVFSNDSIYITGAPTFGTSSTPSPVTTADHHCLFVNAPGTSDGSTAHCATLANVPYYTHAKSRYDVPTETPPPTDTELATIAAQGGCVYSGPTTISFYATTSTHVGYMNVTSPDTPTTGSHDSNNLSTNHTVCVGTTLRLPTATNGNGVIYVKNATGSCATAATPNRSNPFRGLRAGQNSTMAQIAEAGQWAGTTHGYNYTDDVVPVKTADCEGDAFVRDTDSANTPANRSPGIAGNLTVATQNDIVITGSLRYTSCGSTWTSETNCPYRAGTVNDSLGLIANNFTEVNRPVVPKCRQRSTWWSGKTWWTCPSTDLYQGSYTGYGWTPAPTCTTSVTDLQAVLCRPGPNVTIDAAIVDLRHSFAVDNFAASGSTGKLIVYGTIAQYWRGAVGLLGGTGFTKYYTWDSRLQYVSVPSFLKPETPSWSLGSSSTVMSTSCGTWPRPYGTTSSTITETGPTAASC